MLIVHLFSLLNSPVTILLDLGADVSWMLQEAKGKYPWLVMDA